MESAQGSDPIQWVTGTGLDIKDREKRISGKRKTALVNETGDWETKHIKLGGTGSPTLVMVEGRQGFETFDSVVDCEASS